MSAPNVAIAPSPAAAPSPPTWWGPNLSLNFSVKTTLIYVGGSIGVLAVIMCFLMLTMVLWIRPSRRRRQAAILRERRRMATLREVKVEPDTFIPQLRAFPVVVVQPDSSEVACGRKISLDDSYNYSGCKDIETGHAAAPVDSLGGQGIKDSGNLPEEKSGVSSQENKEDTTFNPLTHYLTERQPHLFIAEIPRGENLPGE